MESAVTLSDQFSALHVALLGGFRKANLHLQAIPHAQTVTTRQANAMPTVTYLRLAGEAQTVERLIGLKDKRKLEIKHHPVIELRLTPEWLTLELVLNPEAWYDQRNWLGKLTVPRYREEFRALIADLSPQIRIGAWQGDAPTDRYLTSAQLRFPRVFEAWIGTYCDGRDWLRAGVWYPTDEVSAVLVDELVGHAQALYRIYQYIAWTGRNDFYSLFRADEDRENV